MISRQQLTVTRVSGAKNNFFIVNTFVEPWNHIYPSLNIQQKQDITRKLCSSYYGFKTDGLLFLYTKEGYDFAWDFFNSDGSFAEMCGNAARCASLYYFQNIRSSSKVKFFTGAGNIDAEIIDDRIVKVEMPAISNLKKINISGKEGIFVDTGVPHFVLQTNPDKDLARSLRRAQEFGKSGANITFIDKIDKAKVKAVTFERGVEDFTQACGTGAVAAAIFYQENQGYTDKVMVEMPGGTLLVQGAIANKRPFLSGPTEIEFNLSLAKEELVGVK